MCRVTMGHLRVTTGHLRVTIGHLRVTIGHLRVTMGHLRVTLGHLTLTIGFFSISKHKANTTELHPKVRQTCFIIKTEYKPDINTQDKIALTIGKHFKCF